MATVLFTDAHILVNGSSLRASLTGLTVDYNAELLDETAFGDDTRIHKGGLFVADITVRGHLEFGSDGVEDVFFNAVGDDNTIIVVFADGITEGTTTDKGYAMRGVVESFNFGSAVGTLLPFDMVCRGQGLSVV